MGDSGNRALRTVIVDDEPIAQRALRGYLEDGGIDVICVVANGELGVDATVTSAPDVALIDLGLPGISGVEVTRKITTLAPATKVLVVTASDAESDLAESIRAGATGYLLKAATGPDVVRAVRTVARGEPILSERIAAKLLQIVGGSSSVVSAATGAGVSLNETEVRILQLLASGRDNGEIADELSVGPYTVKNHIANVLGKLQLEDRIQTAVEVRDEIG